MVSYGDHVARWRIELSGDLTPVRTLKKIEVQADGSVIADMEQDELIEHFELLPGLRLELLSVERLPDGD
jgi:hypothetical protein